MGNKIVTVPYDSAGQTQLFENVRSNESAATPTESTPNKQHIRAAVSAAGASAIPSECPMHQAKKDTGACPSRGGESDINPSNMVIN